MRNTCLNQVHQLAARDPRIVFIGSDLGVGTLDQFKREIPDRFFMEGVSEANLIGMAAGLAMEGKIPYVSTIATFLTRRCFEQIVVDLGLHRARVRLIGIGAGVVYAPLGPTHQAIDDLAILRTVPNMTILAPADAEEMRRLMPVTVEVPGPVYIRVAKGGDPVVTRPDMPFVIGKAYVMRDGLDALFVTTGVTLKPALDAATLLSDRGLEAGVLHMPTLKPFDREALCERASGVPLVVSVEEHTVIGGLGSAVAETLAEAGLSGARRLKRIGIPDMFADEYGSQASLFQRFGITAEHLRDTVMALARPSRMGAVS